MNPLYLDILWLILKRIPLRELVHLRLVCPLWNRLIRRICAHRNSLKLLGSQNDVIRYARFVRSGLVDPFTRECFSAHAHNNVIAPSIQLDRVFPRVTKLVCVSLPVERLRLIASSQSNLTSLTVYGQKELVVFDLRPLTSLTTLHLLHSNSDFYLSPEQISRLEQLSLVNSTAYVEHLETLGPVCTRLWLSGVSVEVLEEALAANEKLGTGLKELSIGPLVWTGGNGGSRIDTLKRIWSVMVSRCADTLEYLNAEGACTLKPDDIFTLISRLPHLTSLKLHLKLTNSSVTRLEQYRHIIRPFPAIVNLQLLLYFSSLKEGQFESVIVPRFPGLVNLTVKCRFASPLMELLEDLFMYELFPKLETCELSYQ